MNISIILLLNVPFLVGFYGRVYYPQLGMMITKRDSYWKTSSNGIEARIPMNQACLDIIFSTHALGTNKALDHPPLDFGLFQHLCCLSVLLVTFGLSKFHNTSSHTPILLQQVPLPSLVSWLPFCYGTNLKNRIRHAKNGLRQPNTTRPWAHQPHSQPTWVPKSDINPPILRTKRSNSFKHEKSTRISWFNPQKFQITSSFTPT